MYISTVFALLLLKASAQKEASFSIEKFLCVNDLFIPLGLCKALKNLNRNENNSSVILQSDSDEIIEEFPSQISDESIIVLFNKTMEDWNEITIELEGLFQVSISFDNFILFFRISTATW